MILLRPVSAWLPLLMSVLALLLVAGRLVVVGTAREVDEGAAAHLWQLLIVGQAPFILYYLVRWAGPEGLRGWIVLSLQLIAAVAAVAPIAVLGL